MKPGGLYGHFLGDICCNTSSSQLRTTVKNDESHERQGVEVKGTISMTARRSPSSSS